MDGFLSELEVLDNKIKDCKQVLLLSDEKLKEQKQLRATTQNKLWALEGKKRRLACHDQKILA